MGMLSRLYAYRERPTVSPLENFLTEAFAEFFGRLPFKLKRSLLLALLPPAARMTFDRTFPDLERLAIRTQVSAASASTSKRPDLVIHADGRDLVVIEAKVGAALQQHDDGDQAPDAATARIVRNQLETYARWIAGENGRDGWRGAVVFLTTYTEPPEDFHDGRGDGVFRSTRSWKDVGDWILDEVPIGRTDVTHCALAAELYQFLKERNLMTKYMSARDLAAATLFAQSHTALKTTFMDVLKAVGAHLPKLKGGRRLNADFWSEANIYWGWFHFAKSVKRNASKPYVAVGICFEVAESMAADAAKLPKHEPFFFVACEDEWGAEKPTTFLKAVPDGWVEIQEDCMVISARTVRSFSVDPDERVEELKAWACLEMEKLVALIPKYDEAPVEKAVPEEDAEEA